MTEKVGKPTDRKDDEWQQDLNLMPKPVKTLVFKAPHPEKTNPALNAYEIKELHDVLSGYSSDQLKQVIVLPRGSRLEQGATYVDLMNPERQPFTAMGSMEAGETNWYVPKTEVDYELWNQLTRS